MPRKKKTNGEQPIGIGLTTKQMKRKKPIGNAYLLDIEPITDNQKRLFDSYSENKHLVAYGTAGTGKPGTITNGHSITIQQGTNGAGNNLAGNSLTGQIVSEITIFD